MSFYKRFLSSSILSVLDQGMLSALNFVIGILLMRLVSKDDYGLYGQLYALALLAGLVVDSWIAGPLTTVASAVGENVRQSLLRRYWYRQIFWGCVMAVATLLLVEFVPVVTHHSQKSWTLAFAFAGYVLANGVREYGRTVGFIQGDIQSVLRQDALYVALLAAGLALLYLFQQFNLTLVFACLAAASLLCALASAGSLHARTETSVAVDLDDLPLAEQQEAIAGHGRWAVLGVLVGWLSNYSYVYLSGAWLGVAAIADLNAARLLLMPIPLAVAAWSRVARPVAGRLIAEQDRRGLRRLAWLSVAGIELVVAGYVALLLATLPWLERYLLGAKYHGIDDLVILWGVYFAVNAARWVGTAWLSSGGAFRSMFFLGSSTLALVLLITSYSIPRWGAAGAIVALIAVELYELVVVWKFIFPRLMQENAATSAG